MLRLRIILKGYLVFMRRILFCLLSFLSFNYVLWAQESERLSGIIIGSAIVQGYELNNAFDQDYSTSFQSQLDSKAWVGLDLETPHIITQIAWSPTSLITSVHTTTMAVFEGANREDFLDAVPLYIAIESGSTGEMNYADIEVTRAFRYVRYVGPSESHSSIAELEFWGYEGEGSDSLFYQLTNLPLVSIHVENAKDPEDKVNELVSYISVVSKEGTRVLEDGGTIRLRGNTSMSLGKKPYRVKFDNKHKVLDSEAKARKWVLVPNQDEKTFMRNTIGFEVSRRAGLSFVPYCAAIDLIVNGEYKGSYQWCDQVEVRKNRVDVTEMDETSVDEEELTGGYLIEIDKWAYQEKSWFTSAKGIPVTIKSPDDDIILPAQTQYITNHFNELERLVYEGNENYRNILDVPSFIRYVIASELIGNCDAYHSIFMYKQRGDDHLYTGPVWDLNLSLDNDKRMYPLSNRTRFSFYESWADAGTIRTFISNIVTKDASFIPEMQNTWTGMRQQGIMDSEPLLAFLDSMEVLLDQSQTLNFKRWDTTLTKKYSWQYQAWGTYAAEVTALRKCLEQRIPWMDGMLHCTEVSQEVDIDESGWLPIYYPIAFDKPNGIEVYKIIGTEDNQLLLETVEHPQSNVPYLLHGNPGHYTLTGFKTDEWDRRRNGLLTGTYQNLDVPKDSYIFQSIDGIAKFCLSSDESHIITTHQVYLQIPITDNEAPMFSNYVLTVPKIKGDVDGDGDVDYDDIITLIEILVGISDDCNGTADINEDTILDISDLTTLINMIQ